MAAMLSLGGLSACGSDDTPTSHTPTPGLDAGDTDISDADAGQPDADADQPDADLDAGPDADADSGLPDADPDADADEPPEDFGRTLADYRLCTTDADCPVGLGTCVKDIALNRADPLLGTHVSVAELFALDPDQGICTEVCTNADSACDELSVNGELADHEPYSCQVVVVGESPYPPPGARPALPFADQLNPAELTANVPFGAICRPPFQLDAGVDRGFCQACDGEQNPCAGDSLCYDWRLQRPAIGTRQGTCLAPCEDESGCPMGFACEDVGAEELDDQGNLLPGTRVCVPTARSCGSCIDHDEDGFGLGRCGPASHPVTEVDCDDTNPAAFYSANEPDHPFPRFCAPDQDFNCNGLDDSAEQIGSPEFGDNHCQACGDTCSGAVPNGQASCATGSCIAHCDDPAAFADCDGLLDNGCEQPVDDPSLLYFPDLDLDGYGDARAQPFFACSPAAVPAGLVNNSLDCDDSNPQTYTGAPEICDGKDNNCNQVVDDLLTDTGGSCSTGLQGRCEAGTYACVSGALSCAQSNAAVDEICNGIDDDCDGTVDEGSPDLGVWYRDEDGDGYGVEGVSTQACSPPQGYAQVPGDCDDTRADVHPGRREDCANSTNMNCKAEADETPDDWLHARQAYRDGDGDGYSPSPNTTLAYCRTLPTGYSQALHTGAGNIDCNDANSGVNPGATETCQTPHDDDCDNNVHNAPAHETTPYYRDVDGDGYGGNTSARFCDSAPGNAPPTNEPWVRTGGDLLDCQCTRTVISSGHTYQGRDVHPGQHEQCDGLDNDSDGRTDEGCPLDMGWSYLANPTPWRGITTGEMDDFHCPSHQYLVGFNVNVVRPHTSCASGHVGVWGVEAVCRNFASVETNTVHPFTYQVRHTRAENKEIYRGSYSGSCGVAEGWEVLRCPDGQAVRSLVGSYDPGSRIRKLGVRCAPLEADLLPMSQTPPQEAGISINTIHNTTSAIVPSYNDQGSWPMDDSCQAGTVAVGYTAIRTHLTELRGIRLLCGRVDAWNK
ncbi:hypothetical protein DL240_14700 [Lujinxingia litoralis]|uniref:Disintegrin domain-containing protein n=1 Tax=Lujinxingia litoralis TaxID=2211119 RepID=A0A328C6D1_9DELT|nr:putative metal-binding motif-containing protein [Lujinxingia litoralis]RAL20921.1 hypothetical protein DL240_14700 [Lujinxingia litoralis]